jgi:hypothetical protein
MYAVATLFLKNADGYTIADGWLMNNGKVFVSEPNSTWYANIGSWHAEHPAAVMVLTHSYADQIPVAAPLPPRPSFTSETYRLFNADGQRISTAVTLREGGLLQVFPAKQYVADLEAWKALHPSWMELRNGTHTTFNEAEDIDAKLKELNQKVRNAKTRGSHAAAVFALWSFILKNSTAFYENAPGFRASCLGSIAAMERNPSVIKHTGMSELLRQHREIIASY